MILVYCEGALDLLPDMTAAEQRRHQATAYQQCYRASVNAWVRAHPDQVRAYAARQALDVVLAARAHLRV